MNSTAGMELSAGRNRGQTHWMAGVVPHPVHDVQLTAESLDGTANLQQVQPQSVINGQTSSHPVGEVWRRADEGWQDERKEKKGRRKEGRKEGGKAGRIEGRKAGRNEGRKGLRAHRAQWGRRGRLRNTEQRLTYGVRGQGVVLQVLVPFVELFLHPVHERLLESQTARVTRGLHVYAKTFQLEAAMTLTES